jgi:hypothetical protein
MAESSGLIAIRNSGARIWRIQFDFRRMSELILGRVNSSCHFVIAAFRWRQLARLSSAPKSSLPPYDLCSRRRRFCATPRLRVTIFFGS